jgi:hypothetical protein
MHVAGRKQADATTDASRSSTKCPAVHSQAQPTRRIENQTAGKGKDKDESTSGVTWAMKIKKSKHLEPKVL